MASEMEMEKKSGDILKVTDDDLKPISYIEGKILTVRGMQVMFDRDLAELYKVETKVLNQSVKRNYGRFPEHFMFQLTSKEYASLRSQFVTSNEKGGVRYLPYAFTEQGIAMLSAILRGPVAISVSIRIMEAFVAMRQFIASNVNLVQRLETIEYNQLEMRQNIEITNKRVDEVFDRLDSHNPPIEGIFYEGQIFDAHAFVSDLIRSAKIRIILIDNYIDDTVLKRLDKRDAGVSAAIYTQRVTPKLQTDINTHNAQYPTINVLPTSKVHDRFMIIDETVYHIGASIKDLGKKVFAFSKMSVTPDDLIKNIQ